MEFREKRDKVLENTLGGKADVSLREFLAVPDVIPEDGDTWGNWTFRRAHLLLEYRNRGSGDDYEIDLEDIHSPLAIVLDLNQMSGKCFASPEDIGNLFLAINDLAGPPWYTPETDVAASIVKRFPALNSRH